MDGAWFKARPLLLAALAQLVRALVCGTRGPQFETERRYHFLIIANYFIAARLVCIPTEI